MKKIHGILALLFMYAWQLNAQGCSCCSGNTGGFASNIINDHVGLQTKNSWLLDLMYDYRLFKPYTSKDLQKVSNQKSDVMGVSSVWVSSLRVSYGMSDRLSLSALLPYINISTTVNQKVDEQHYHTINSSPTLAFTDASLFATYLFYNKNNVKLSAMGGIELPTGKLPKQNGQIITGSGTFDPMTSLAASKSWAKFSVRTNLAYKLTTLNSNGTDYGDFLNYQLGLNYQLTKASSDTLNCTVVPKTPTLSLGLTLLGENLHAIKESGVLLNNTGFYRNFVSLSSTLSLKNKFAIYVAADVPITQNNYGVQNASSYRFKIGTSLKIN
jgi:hypothetical protein